jgi:uncharacterized membrane protein YvlD (DUF360 family)
VSSAYGEAPAWTPERPRLRPGQLVLAWLLGAVSLVVATKLVPGASHSTFRAALVVAALLAVLNAILPPLVAALRLPFTALLGFFAVLALDAGMLLLADRYSDGLTIDSFWAALAVALVASAVGVVLSVVFGTNDDDVYSLSVVQRIARRSGERQVTDTPGIVFLEIDGLALPVLQRAMRDGHAPTLARWLEDGSHRLTEWEPDLSSQTGASQGSCSARTTTSPPSAGSRRSGRCSWSARRPRTAPSSNGGTHVGPGCSRTAARAEATSSRAAPTTSS